MCARVKPLKGYSQFYRLRNLLWNVFEMEFLEFIESDVFTSLAPGRSPEDLGKFCDEKKHKSIYSFR